MRLLFLVSGSNEVSCRFRVWQLLPGLRARGWEVDVVDLHVPWRERWRRLESATTYDRVCIHRAFLGTVELRRLRRDGVRYVYDFDDAIMFRDSSHRRPRSWQRRWRFARMTASAAAVVAGNAYLAEQARAYSRKVSVLPTAVDLSRYPTAPAPSGEPLVGWIGTRVNLMYLSAIAPGLAALARRRPDMRLKIVSDGFVELPGVQALHKPWILEEEVDDLRSLRVGIMPLTDDPWTRGKCAVKILQYYAAGIPVVCSPVGTNLEIVEHGRTGYFARDPQEWADRLAELLADPDRCRAFGQAGRALVERRYSLAAVGERFAKALQLR
jgi:glycosyltransferase involved in cell wall biosynthesis